MYLNHLQQLSVLKIAKIIPKAKTRFNDRKKGSTNALSPNYIFAQTLCSILHNELRDSVEIFPVLFNYKHSIQHILPVLVNSRVICPSSSLVENHLWQGNSTVSPVLGSSTVTCKVQRYGK